MDLLYLKIALIINKKLYDEQLITEFLYIDADNEIYKKMRNYGFIRS